MNKQELINALNESVNVGLRLAQARSEKEVSNIKEMTTTASVASGGLLPEVIDKIHTNLAPQDLSWQKGFIVKDLRNSGKNSFRVRKITDAITFSAKNEGIDADVYAFTGTLTDVTFQTMRAAAEFSYESLEDGDWFEAIDNVNAMYNAYSLKQTEVAIDLFQAVSNHADYNVILDTTGTSDMDKINKTLNDACEELITAKLATAGTQFVMFCPLSMKSRIELAKKNVPVASASLGVTCAYNIEFIYSPFIDWTTEGGLGSTQWVGKAADGKLPLGYLTIGGPDCRHRFAIRQDLTLEEQNNIKSHSKLIAGAGRYAGCVDPVTVRRVLQST